MRNELTKEITRLKRKRELVERHFLKTHSLIGGTIKHHEDYTKTASPLDIAIELEERRHYLEYKIKELEEMQELIQGNEPRTKEELSQLLQEFRKQKLEKSLLTAYERESRHEQKSRLENLEDLKHQEKLVLKVENLTDAEKTLSGKKVLRLKRKRLPESYLVTALYIAK